MPRPSFLRRSVPAAAVLTIFMVFGLASCDMSSVTSLDGVHNRLTVIPANVNLAGPGERARLSARIGEGETDANWKSSDPQVIVVFRNGNTVAREPGDALVSVQAQGQNVNVPVHVGERGNDGNHGNNGNNGDNGSEEGAEAIVLSEDNVEFDALGETLTVLVKKVDGDGSEVEDYPVNWRSENPDVVTVDSQGKLTARAQGTTNVIADADCCGEETVKVTVRQVVTAVAITAGALTLQVGETTTFDATAKDANGHEVPGASFEWSSSDRGVATVDQKGKVTARDDGDASIRAAVEDAVGDVEVTVGSGGGTKTSGSLNFPNEPAGFQRWAEHDMRSLPDGNLSHQGYANTDYGSNYVIVEDGSAPNGKALRIRYPEGMRGGVTPGRFFVWDQDGPDSNPNRNATELDEFYISLHIKLDGPDWEFPSSELKMYYMAGGRLGSQGWSHLGYRTSQFGNYTSGEVLYSPEYRGIHGSVRAYRGEPAPRYRHDDEPRHLHQVGEWRHIEYYRKTSDVNVENGILKLWVDGHLLIHETGILDQTDTDGDYTMGFHQFHWAPVFGGGYNGGDPDEDGRHYKSRDDFMRLGHLYISGVPR